MFALPFTDRRCAQLCHVLFLSVDTWTQLVLRSYGAVFGIAVVCSECELASFLKIFPFLESWVARGLFLILWVPHPFRLLDILLTQPRVSVGLQRGIYAGVMYLVRFAQRD